MIGPIVSFCKRDIMSVCTAASDVEQNRCQFYEKSRLKNKCMYFIFDEYCDCLKAQMDATKEVYA
jgi:hypothetical protein